MTKTHLLLWACLSAFSMTHQAQADAPVPLVSYEGTLPDAGASAAGKRISFSLYDGPDAQTPVWGPQHFDNVAVIEGRYHVLLGTTDAAGRALPDLSGSAPRYLGVSVEGRELQPRQRLLSALTGLATRTDAPATPEPPGRAGQSPQALPVGTIVAYWSSRPPEGWLPCDGSIVPGGTQFDTLRGLTGPRLPDLRGLFLRGLGQNGDAAFRYAGDAARGLGELQQDEFRSHAHPFDDYTFSENSGVAGKAWGQAGKSDIDNSPGSPFTHATSSAGGDETRPRNAGVYWIIKY